MGDAPRHPTAVIDPLRAIPFFTVLNRDRVGGNGLLVFTQTGECAAFKVIDGVVVDGVVVVRRQRIERTEVRQSAGIVAQQKQISLTDLTLVFGVQPDGYFIISKCQVVITEFERIQCPIHEPVRFSDTVSRYADGV